MRISANPDLARKCMANMFREFSIAKDLDHPSIVEYKYFVKKYDGNSHEFHLLTEFLPEGDMNQFLRRYGPQNLTTIKKIGR